MQWDNPWKTEVKSESQSDADPNTLTVAKVLPPDLLLIVFIHGYAHKFHFKSTPILTNTPLFILRFKGTDSTFSSFPERLKHLVSETISNIVVESIVFPAYEV